LLRKWCAVERFLGAFIPHVDVEGDVAVCGDNMAVFAVGLGMPSGTELLLSQFGVSAPFRGLIAVD
jgi:hypothetical protein